MAITIRLKRMGKHKTPFYRIVAIDKRRDAKGGEYVEEIGHYNPTKNPAAMKVDKEKVAKWVSKGATVSATVKSILKKMDMQDVLPKKAVKKKTKKEKK